MREAIDRADNCYRQFYTPLLRIGSAWIPDPVFVRHVLAFSDIYDLSGSIRKQEKISEYLRSKVR